MNKKNSHIKSQSHHIPSLLIERPHFATVHEEQQTLPNVNSKLTLAYYNNQLKDYTLNKQSIKDGFLTSRKLRSVLRPNKLKWESNAPKLTTSKMRTKLQLADYFLNQKGEGLKSQTFEQIKQQYSSPKKQENQMVQFIENVRMQSNKKQRIPDIASPSPNRKQQQFFQTIRAMINY